MLASQPKVPEWDASQLRRAIDAAGVALWSWDVDTDRLALDERAYELWGLSKDDADVSFDDLSRRIHPADRDLVGQAFAATRELPGPFEIDFRILVAGAVRWVSAKGQGDAGGIVGRTKYGLFLDVTGRKRAEETNALLAAEMSHRVKNLLGIAVSLANIAARSTDTTQEMARQFTSRLIALGRAHDLVRPAPGSTGESGDVALLNDLLSALLAPYGDGDRIAMTAPRIGIGEAAATAFALVIHELATNSMKYGALSTETGTLDLACRVADDTVVVRWRERGGPAKTAKGPAGFGSELVELSVSRQLGGTIEYDWTDLGLDVTLRVETRRLSPRSAAPAAVDSA